MHRTKVRVVEDALDANNTIAQRQPRDFDRAGVTVVNFMSAPGAGKTTLLERVLARARRRARRRARGRRAGQHGRRPAGAACTSRSRSSTPTRLRRRVPSRREHGALGAAVAAARRDRPAGDRERRQPRLPGRVPGRRGRAGDGVLGDRGRGQAAQVPADVPRLRAGAGQQDRPAPAPRLRPRQAALQPRRRASRAWSACSSARGPARASTSGASGSRGRRCRRGGAAREDRALGADALERAGVDEALAERTRANEAFFEAEAERLARLCHRMAERFARGGRLVAFGSSPGRALRRPPRRGRVRPPGDRRQARAAGDRARGRGRPRSSAQVDLSLEPDDIAIALRRRRAETAAAALALARARGCLTIAFAPRGAEWEFAPPSDDPSVAPGAGRDALPRALGARARVLRAPRPARGPRARGRCTTPAPRASSTRSSPRPRPTSRRCVEDVRRSVLAKAERDRRAARADAERERGELAGRRGGAARLLDARRQAARARQRRLGDRRDGRRRRLPPAARRRWPPRRAIDLTEDPAILTAIANDIGAEAIFARQVIAYGRAGDALLALSTSGNSANVIERAGRGAAARAARRSRWSATTAGGSPPSELADHVIVTRSEHIPRIQEAQASAYHVLRELVEDGRDGGSRSAPTRAAASAPASRARSRASASGPTSTASRASSASTAGCSTTARGVLVEVEGERRRRRARSSRGSPPRRRRWPRVERVIAERRCRRPASGGFAIRASPRAGEPGAPVTPDTRDLRRLPGASCSTRRPPPPLPVHQLHELRPALHDRARRPLRPAADDDGRLRDVRGLPRRVRGPGRPALPRPAERLPGVRAAAGAARSRRVAGARSRSDALAAPRARCAPARSSRSRASAATTWPAAPTTRTRSAALRGRKHREDKPFALMARDLDAARALADVGAAEAALLSRPRGRSCCCRGAPERRVAAAVAPALARARRDAARTRRCTTCCSRAARRRS